MRGLQVIMEISSGSGHPCRSASQFLTRLNICNRSCSRSGLDLARSSSTVGVFQLRSRHSGRLTLLSLHGRHSGATGVRSSGSCPNSPFHKAAATEGCPAGGNWTSVRSDKLLSVRCSDLFNFLDIALSQKPGHCHAMHIVVHSRSPLLSCSTYAEFCYNS